MRNKIIIMAAALALLASAAKAEDISPEGAALNQDWMALNIALGHVQHSLSQYIETSRRQLAESESQRKWVLDNWVPKAHEPAPGK